jgi:hypothetical protein
MIKIRLFHHECIVQFTQKYKILMNGVDVSRHTFHSALEREERMMADERRLMRLIRV